MNRMTPPPDAEPIDAEDFQTRGPRVGDAWYRWVYMPPYGARSTPTLGPAGTVVVGSVGLERAYVHVVTPGGVRLAPWPPGAPDIDERVALDWQRCEHLSGCGWVVGASGRYKPTIEDAWRSYVIRTERRIVFAQQQLHSARGAMALARAGMPVAGGAA